MKPYLKKMCMGSCVSCHIYLHPSRPSKEMQKALVEVAFEEHGVILAFYILYVSKFIVKVNMC